MSSGIYRPSDSQSVTVAILRRHSEERQAVLLEERRLELEEEKDAAERQRLRELLEES